MSACELQPDDERFHGNLAGRDLLELLKMLHRTCASGVLHLDAGPNRASLCIDQGAIRAAFYNDAAGSSALSRIILIGTAEFRFELGTAHTVASYAVNISKDTALILSTVERLIDEHHRPAAPATAPAVGRAGDGPLSSPYAAAAPAAPAAPAASATASAAAGSPPARAAGHTSTLRATTAADLGPEADGLEQTGTIRIAAFHLPEPGSRMGKCELVAEIGRGASSVVYRARHTSLNLDVVVKVLMQADNEGAHHALLTANEAHLLARLNHPNILRIFDFADGGLFPHLVMELVDGPSLAALIARNQRLEPALALPLVCQTIAGLAYAHAQVGLVHCDLKPTNILLTSDYQVKIADFGLAKSRGMPTAFDQTLKLGTIAGTPAYIAPEQVEGGRAAADHRSDIYALGATMYHAITGRLPFIDDDPVQLMVRRLSEAPIPPHLVHPKVDRRISQLIMSMMARDPANRIQTYDELLELTTDLLEGSFSPELQRPESDGDSRIIRRRSSFWNYVPNRLFRRNASHDGEAVG
jgi:tRNA A-37 threonylcarbamoyl transferase component Bud32